MDGSAACDLMTLLYISSNSYWWFVKQVGASHVQCLGVLATAAWSGSGHRSKRDVVTQMYFGLWVLLQLSVFFWVYLICRVNPCRGHVDCHSSVSVLQTWAGRSNMEPNLTPREWHGAQKEICNHGCCSLLYIVNHRAEGGSRLFGPLSTRSPGHFPFAFPLAMHLLDHLSASVSDPLNLSKGFPLGLAVGSHLSQTWIAPSRLVVVKPSKFHMSVNCWSAARGC